MKSPPFYSVNSLACRRCSGSSEKATPENPGVVMDSVHHFFKEVAGKPLIRPAWFFDVRQEGEAIPDVGTHLIDHRAMGMLSG